MIGAPGGHVGDVVDEHHAEVAEAVDDELVVDDLVVAVDGRLEGRTIHASALMAISTPAQKPRGEASSTRSTSITTEATQGLRRILGGCPPRESSPSRPVRRGAGRAGGGRRGRSA